MPELLAVKLRPKNLSEVIGQKHLIGEGKVLSNLVKNRHLVSCILYGKPGIGKTSIANAIVGELGCKYRSFNAVINNKKDLDVIIEEARLYEGMVLILDEIHRLNKDKQDLLLPYLESGLITLIGMTTANVYHSINPAIRSRCQLFELKSLDDEDIREAIVRVKQSGLLEQMVIEEEACNYIINFSGADLRCAYNLLETAYYASSDGKITVDLLKDISTKANVFMDKNDDGYYDVISAFQKSIRGSDVDAALHYLARLIESDNLEIITRRLSVIVYEDIGLANPGMGPKVMAAIDASLRLGLPEARIPLSAIVIEMALSPKSNSAELAIDRAINDVRSGRGGNVPDHIKTTARDYLYPHDYKNSFVSQQYLPDKLSEARYYFPKNNKNEKLLKGVMDNLNSLRS